MRKEKNLGIIGPTEDEARELNKLNGSTIDSPLKNWGFLIPSTLAVPAVVAACGPGAVAEVRTAEEMKIPTSTTLIPLEKAELAPTAGPYKAYVPVIIEGGPSTSPQPSPTEASKATDSVPSKASSGTISKETATFKTLPPEEAKQREEETFFQERKIKFPVPSFIGEEGVTAKLIEVERQMTRNVVKETDLIIKIPIGKTVEMPALTDGSVTNIALYENTLIEISVLSEDADPRRRFGLTYLLPADGIIQVKTGDHVSIGKSLFKATYRPDSPVQGGFENLLSKDRGNEVKNAAIVIGTRAGSELLTLASGEVATIDLAD